MYCKECGNEIANDSKFCANCGKSQGREVVSNPENSNADLLELKDEIKKLRQEEHYRRLEQNKPKKKVALLLCFFLGGLGAHRFYVGKIGTGILMLLFGITIITLSTAAEYISLTADIYERKLSGGVSTFATMCNILGAIFCIWLLIDLIRIITGSFIDSNYYDTLEDNSSYGCWTIILFGLIIVAIIVIGFSIYELFAK